VAAHFDVSDLPASFRAQLHALKEGDEITLVENGQAVATVLPGQRVLVGRVIPAPVDDDRQLPNRPGLKVVATGMKVSERVRAYLSLALGDEYAVVDIRKAPETVDALLVPPLSAQALAILRSQFPSARLIVTEFDDPESGTWIAGPITRAKAAGAHAYLTPGNLGELAAEVRDVVEGRDDRALPSGSRPATGVRELGSDS
jgi:antitoxin (DNA-binding transcriptional repressor) of toxin-antitoxin stability system